MTDPETQRRYWTAWNIDKRDRALSETSTRQMKIVLEWLAALGRRDLSLLEVGCGAAWLTPHLREFGAVTATDLSQQVVEEAAQRLPGVRFIGGDFFDIDFPDEAFDAIVSLEVLAHVADQRAFLAKIARLLRPGGQLLLATQNRPVLERMNRVPPTEGQLRRWVDRDELEALLVEHFDVLDLFSVTPRGNKGLWRIINSPTFNAPLRMVAGDSVERFKERRGWGWTLMARASKKE